MSKYIPYPFYHDDVPVDISFVFEGEKPAGKHGFISSSGRDFQFADGTKMKFWGTNLNGGANFPDHEYAKKLARRLAKIGINLVRFHQLDAEWNTPNIFAFTKGKRVESTSDFDSESMDRLDYLIYCLKNEGIYCYLDMYTYRKFKSGDGVENAENLIDAAKPYGSYSRKLIELQKELCLKLWSHENPYTGLKYLDDPVFVMAEIVNESNFFFPANPFADEPYISEFRALLAKWLVKNNIDKKAEDFDLNNMQDEILAEFKSELQAEYYTEMTEYMRSIGIKIPIAGTNMPYFPANIKAQLGTDYMDGHVYLYDWRWMEFENHCANTSITENRASFLGSHALMNQAHMPFYMSEWDMPWPNEYRAESPLYCAAIGCLQDWSGFSIHTYAYTSELYRMTMLGREISANKIGNTPFRQGIFSTWNDPAKFGLFYHAALITRRGDVSEAKNLIKIKLDSMTDDNPHIGNINIEKSRIETSFTEGEPFDSFDTPDTGELCSDTGELYRNWNKKIGSIDTPRTKCAYGFIGRNAAFELSGVRIKGITDFGVVAISSLNDSPICSSDNMLLTTVGRAHNTDSKFSGDLMLEAGKPPVLCEVIEAEIEIETSVTGLKVWAISAEGLYIGTLPARYENGRFIFKTGDVSQSIYYLIVKE